MGTSRRNAIGVAVGTATAATAFGTAGALLGRCCKPKLQF
jgi:hypothetical protein